MSNSKKKNSLSEYLHHCLHVSDKKMKRIIAKKTNLDINDEKIDEINDNVYDIVSKHCIDSFIYVSYNESSDIYPKKKLFGKEIIDDFLDFYCWTWTIYRIPFYQSLGDTIGFYYDKWKNDYYDSSTGFEMINDMIYDFIYKGGINNIEIDNWVSSEDTILYLATLDVLTENHKLKDVKILGEKLRDAYLSKIHLLENRDSNQSLMDSLNLQKSIKWDELSYNKNYISNGSATRSGCIGIFFPGKINRDILISLSIESSRITHNSTVSNLASVTSALFTSFALEKIPINLWPYKLLKIINNGKIDSYIKKSHLDEHEKFLSEKILFVGKWENYLNKLFLGVTPRTDIRHLKNPIQRYKYLTENFSKGYDTPGSQADDSIILAYDSLLQSGGVFEKLIFYSILHPGNSKSIGSLSFSWYGTFYHSVENELMIKYNLSCLEYNKKIFSNFDKIIKKLGYVFFNDIYISLGTTALKEMNYYE